MPRSAGGVGSAWRRGGGVGEVDGRVAWGEGALDGGDKGLDELVGVEAAKLRDTDAVGIADAGEVVAEEIDDHHVFGALLGRAAKGSVLRNSVFGGRSALRRPFHRPRQELAAVPVEKQLGRDRQNPLVAGVQKSRVTAGLGALQGMEQGFGRIKTRCTGQHARHLCREIDLVELAAGTGLLNNSKSGVEVRTFGQA